MSACGCRRSSPLISTPYLGLRSASIVGSVGDGVRPPRTLSTTIRHNPCMDAECAALRSIGSVTIDDGFRTADDAFAYATAIVEAVSREDLDGPLSIVGDFVLPPVDGPSTRDFQTLHFDFGLPLDPKVDQDIARYTALYVPAGRLDVSAVTRLVPLRELLEQRTWPAGVELLREARSGPTAARTAPGQCAGIRRGKPCPDRRGRRWSLAGSPERKDEGDFLCGLEFDSLRAEVAFFAFTAFASRRSRSRRVAARTAARLRQPRPCTRPKRYASARRAAPTSLRSPHLDYRLSVGCATACSASSEPLRRRSNARHRIDSVPLADLISLAFWSDSGGAIHWRAVCEPRGRLPL